MRYVLVRLSLISKEISYKINIGKRSCFSVPFWKWWEKLPPCINFTQSSIEMVAIATWQTDNFILKIIITENKPSFDKQVELV